MNEFMLSFQLFSDFKVPDNNSSSQISVFSNPRESLELFQSQLKLHQLNLLLPDIHSTPLSDRSGAKNIPRDSFFMFQTREGMLAAIKSSFSMDSKGIKRGCFNMCCDKKNNIEK
jgi:hypothetical protein